MQARGSSHRLLSTLACGVAVFTAGAIPAAAQCWSETALLVDIDGLSLDSFGASVSISGDSIVVGSPGDNEPWDDTGAAFVMDRNLGGIEAWGEVAKLIPSDGQAGARFGVSASIHGDTVVVGAYHDSENGSRAGAAYVYERNHGGPDNWGEATKLLASNGTKDDHFGLSVSVWGDTIVVGAPDVGNGVAYLFERDRGGPGNWGEFLMLLPSSGGGDFGDAVAIEGDTIVVGCPLHDGKASNAGAAFVFERDEGGLNNWGETAMLRASDGTASDTFGQAVSISGGTLAIGAPQDDHSASRAGSAYIFERGALGATSWTRTTKLLASDGDTNDVFGDSLSIWGDTLLVGAPANQDVGFRTGSAYSFERNRGGPDNWGETRKLLAPDPFWYASFGGGVSIEGDTFVVGAFGHEASFLGTGAAYVYELNSSSCPETYCTTGKTAGGCQALMFARGNPSASAPSGFDLAAYAEGGRPGVFFFGTNGRQATPWGNGNSYQCIVPPVSRGGTSVSSGMPGTCHGSFVQDVNARWTARPNQNPGAGAVVQAQLWYRDPQNTSNQTTSLSNAVEFTVQP